MDEHTFDMELLDTPVFGEIDADRWWRLTQQELPVERDEAGWVPEGLAGMVPGVLLAAMLTGMDESGVAARDRVILLAARQRLISHLQARSYRDMAVLEDYFDRWLDVGLGRGAAAMEVAAALHLTRRGAEQEVDTARTLTHRIPRVRDAMQRGDLDYRRARVCALGTDHLSDDQARAVVDEVIDRAPGWTSGQLRARLRRACVEADPDDARRRYDHAVSERKVTSRMTEAGTVNLCGIDLPADRAAAALERINYLARSLPREGDHRTADQRCADVMVDLLLGTHIEDRVVRRNRGVIDLHVDLATLAGLDERGGDLGGYGPIVADLARQIADQHLDAQWRYTVTQPDTGDIAAAGITRRRPTAAQRRYIAARDRTCVFPGCRQPALRSDIDHRTQYQEGGATHPDNQAPLCRYHHDGKDRLGWTYQRQPNGDYLWISPLGHTYTTHARDP